MKKYTMFASNLKTIEEISELKNSEQSDKYTTLVTPSYEVEANDLYEAINIVGDHFDLGNPRHTVFSLGTHFDYYVKVGDKFINVSEFKE